MPKLAYSSLFIVSVFGILWFFSSDSQNTSSETHSTQSNILITSNNENSSININNELDVSIPSTDTHDCDNNCQEHIELLGFKAELTDEKYEELLNRSHELATYLRENPNVQAEFIELASNASPNQRNIIITVFNQLDLNARSALGEALIESSDWHSRFDGISFLAQEELMNEQLAQHFLDILPAESEYYVRSNIVKALNQPDKFYGHQDIINTLEEIEYSDENNTVRGEALLARIQLETNPEAVFNDTFLAIRSDETEYQNYGLRALEKIINKKTSNDSPISWEYQNEAKALTQELLSTKYDHLSANFHKTANNLLAPFI